MFYEFIDGGAEEKFSMVADLCLDKAEEANDSGGEKEEFEAPGGCHVYFRCSVDRMCC